MFIFSGVPHPSMLRVGVLIWTLRSARCPEFPTLECAGWGTQTFQLFLLRGPARYGSTNPARMEKRTNSLKLVKPILCMM